MNLSKKLGLGLVAFLLTLSLLEFGARQIFKPVEGRGRLCKTKDGTFPWSCDFRYLKFQDKKAHYKLCYPSNKRQYFDSDNCVQFSVNSTWHREVEREEIYKDKRNKIIFIGDSFTYGEGVKMEDIFTEKLKYHFNHTGKVIYNLSSPGGGIEYAFSTIKEIIPKLKNVQIAIQWGVNDFVSYGDLRRNIERPQYFFSHFKLFHFFFHRYMDKKETEREENYYNNLSNSKEHFKLLIKLIAYLRNSSTDFFFYNFPEPYWMGKNHGSLLHREVLSILKKNNVASINVAKNFDLKNMKQYFVHKIDPHPNEIAHHEVYTVLSEYMRNN